MYTVGSLADFISGADTPKKEGVNVKEVAYKQVKKETKLKKHLIKTDNAKPAGKKGQFVKREKQGKKQIKSENGKSNGNKKANETSEQTPDSILKNKKLTNAEKRVILKRKSEDTETPKKPKKPKVEKKIHPDNSNNDERTVFVGNVPLDTNYSDLKKFFTKYGKIESVRFRSIPSADMKTPKKLALINKKFHPKRKTMNAYVVFESDEGATRAQSANGELFKDNHLRVDSLNYEADNRKSIFIGNLPLDAAEEDVRKLFNDCGQISNVRLVRDRRTNVGKGFGFVNFDSPDATELALQLENVLLGKRLIRIQRCSNPAEQNKKKTADGKKIRERHSVHINNLPKGATETEIRELFKKCGKILSVRISKGPKDTFCYINFDNSKAVQKAANIKEPTLRNVILKVNESKPAPKTQNKEQPAIYIKGLPIKTKVAQVREAFEDCGNIKYIKLLNKKTQPTAVGFVNFETEEAVNKALKKKVKIGDNEIEISRKVTKQPTTETEEEPERAESAHEEEAEEDSDADQELINDINGTKNWEEDSDSNDSDEEGDEEKDANDDDDDEDGDEEEEEIEGVEASDDNEDEDDDDSGDDDDNVDADSDDNEDGDSDDNEDGDSDDED